MNKKLLSSPVTFKKFQLIFSIILLTIGIGFLFFCIRTSSDVLIEEILARALYSRGLSAWFDLLFTFAPAYFPDFTGYLLAKLLGLEVIFTVYIATLFQVAMLLLSVGWLMRELNVRRIEPVTTLILFAAFVVLLSAHYPDMFLWYYSTNDNLSATIVGFLALTLTLVYLRSPTRLLWVTLLILTAFGVINGRLFILTFIAPALVTCAIFSLLLLRNCFIKSIKNLQNFTIPKILIAILLGLISGLFFFEPLINPYSTAAVRLANKIKPLQSLYGFFTVLHNALQSGDNILLGLILVGIILFIIATWIGLRATLRILGFQKIIPAAKADSLTNNAVDFFYLFCTAAIFSNLLGPIIAGQINEAIQTFRYFSTLFTIVPLLLLLAFSTDKTLHFKKWAILRVNTILIFIVALLLATVFTTPHRTINQVLQRQPSTKEAKITICLDHYADQYNLHYGVSDYWDSYPMSILSKKSIWINSVCSNMEPCVSLDRYLYKHPPGSDGKNPNLYNFVLVSNNKQFGFSGDIIRNSVGEPDHILKCPDEYEIFVFDKNIVNFNLLLQQRFNNLEFQDGKFAQLKITRSQWMRLWGDWQATPSPDIDQNTPLGWAYGAFRKPMKKGRYLAEITLRVNVTASNNSNMQIAAVGFGDTTEPFNPAANNLGSQGIFIYGKNTMQYFKHEFEVTRMNQNNPWGFWIYNYGGGNVHVYDATVTRLEDI